MGQSVDERRHEIGHTPRSELTGDTSVRQASRDHGCFEPFGTSPGLFSVRAAPD